MLLLFIGISALVVLVLTVTGAPVAYYAKRDRKWRDSEFKTPEFWYRW